MKTSTRGRKLIKEFEGLRTTAYKDIVGVWTIGYGHTNAAGSPKVKPGMSITTKEADDILIKDLKKYEDAVNRNVKVPITQNQFDALVSFTFNLGEGNLRKSTLLKRLNSGDYKVGDEFLKWNRAGGRLVRGLLRRRQEEKKLFEMKDSVTVKAEHAAPTVILAVGASAAYNFTHYLPIIIISTIIVSIISYSLFKSLRKG